MIEDLRSRLFATSLYDLTLRGGTLSEPVRLLPQVFPNDPTAGKALLEGHLAVEETIGDFHAFDWLGDLIVLASDAAAERAATWTKRWLDSYGRWHPNAWRPDLLGRRLVNWLTHYAFLREHTDSGAIAAAVHTQGRHLRRVVGTSAADADRLAAVHGLFALACVTTPSERHVNRAVSLLEAIITDVVLPDGGHISRNPSQQLSNVRRLTEIEAILAFISGPQPQFLRDTIDRMAPMLRALRHGDGGLALFNGSRTEDPGRIDLVLRQSGSRAKPLSSAPHSGFQRLASRRTVIVVDTGTPTAFGDGAPGHAGTLSFELSIGRQRMVVNCGSTSLKDGPWRDALRATAAHSTLILDDTNSSDLVMGHGFGERRPSDVWSARREVDGNLLLEARQGGYEPCFGLTHQRSIYLAANGEDIRGEDTVSGSASKPFTVRFHLHPRVQASAVSGGGAVLLRPTRGTGWRFRAEGGAVSLEESIYFGDGQRRRSQQIVVAGVHQGPETSIKWRFSKEQK